MFDAKAVIKADLSRKKGRGYTFFALGGGGERISNVSIRSKGGRARVEFPVIPETDKAIFVICFGVEDFLISDCEIHDTMTTTPLIGLGPDFKAGPFAMPTDGTIRNLTAYNCQYGYGLIQAGAARSVHFENLHGVGGVTLRLETGPKEMNEPQWGGVCDIIAKNISCTDGHAAVPA